MNKIQEVKQRVDIIKVAEYLGLNLNRAKQCKCIWHNEKTASLSFSQSKQIFKCFGCGQSGDVITLTSKLSSINLTVILHPNSINVFFNPFNIFLIMLGFFFYVDNSFFPWKQVCFSAFCPFALVWEANCQMNV